MEGKPPRPRLARSSILSQSWFPTRVTICRERDCKPLCHDAENESKAREGKVAELEERLDEWHCPPLSTISLTWMFDESCGIITFRKKVWGSQQKNKITAHKGWSCSVNYNNIQRHNTNHEIHEYPRIGSLPPQTLEFDVYSLTYLYFAAVHYLNSVSVTVHTDVLARFWSLFTQQRLTDEKN